MFQLRTNLWRTRPVHIGQRCKQPQFLHPLWRHLPTPPWVLCISLVLSILCRWIQCLLHSHWCWSVLPDLVYLCKLVCWLSHLSRTWFGKTRNESNYLEALIWNSSLLFSCPWMFSLTILNHFVIWQLLTIVLTPRSLPHRRFQGSREKEENTTPLKTPAWEANLYDVGLPFNDLGFIEIVLPSFSRYRAGKTVNLDVISTQNPTLKTEKTPAC